MTDIRDLFHEVIAENRKGVAYLASRLDEWGVSILEAIDLLAPRTPARIVQTSSKGSTTMANVQLTPTETDTIGLSIADADGNVIPGVALDAGATVTVAPDGSVLSAVLSADQTSVLVTPVPGAPSATGVSVTVNGTVGGVAMTPDPTVYDFTAASVPVPTSIVQTPAPPVDATAPAPLAAVPDAGAAAHLTN